MREYYAKLGRYIAALLKHENPDTVITLVNNPIQNGPKLVFQRIIVCFDGIRRGWIEGCRRLLCVNAYFLKTFLGGQLLAAAGIDGNDQMYPVYWAVVEGKNNDSRVLFFT